MDDDLDPIVKRQEQKNLNVMSIKALHEYVSGLEIEIERAREAIAVKERAHSDAESVFRT